MPAITADEAGRVLACPMIDDHNDSGAETVGGYFRALLLGVWEDQECFDGKRPFGNSGWYMDVYIAVGKGMGLKGIVFDEWGYVESTTDKFDKQCERYIRGAIEYIFGADAT